MRKTALFAVTVVWGIATVLSFYTGRRYENQKIADHLRKQAEKQRPGRFSPGDRDPRRGR